MNPTYIPVLTTTISVCGSLIVAIGTWNISMKQARQKEHDEIMNILNAHKEETSNEVRSLQGDLTEINATFQTQIALIDQKIDTLSSRVEKHNNVIERTYELEKKSAIHEEQIKGLMDK